MANSSYAFVTLWAFDAPIESVWTALSQPEEWPRWWKGILVVEPIEAGDAVTGAGAYYRMVMRSALPYRLAFNVRTIRRERPTTIEAVSDGELAGTGLWTLSSTPTGTAVRYDWNVDATRVWMRVLAPIARPIFEWNHDVIMRWGEEGLRRKFASGASST